MRGGVYIEVGKWRKDWKEERRDERSGGCQRVERNGNGLLLSLLRLIGSGISLSLSLLFAFVFFSYSIGHCFLRAPGACNG